MSGKSRLARGRGILTGGLLVLALVFGALLAGCGGSSSDSGAVPESRSGDEQVSSADLSEVTWAFPGDPLDTIAPVVGNYLAGISLFQNVTRGLLAYDEDGNLHPELASRWHRASPTVYEYTLRDGLKFSDGKPVTMEDVLYSLNTQISTKTGGPLAGLFASVKSFESNAPNQVTMTLKHPDATADYFVAYYAMGIYEKAASIRAHSTPGQPRGIPIGTGAYKVSKIGADSVTLMRNAYYQGTRPKADRVVVRFIADDATRLAALEAGDVDGTFVVPPANTPQWQKVSSIRLLSVPSNLVVSSTFNTTKAPFDDVHARRALMYAFNREAVVQKVLHDNARVATTLVTPELYTNEGLDTQQAEARIAKLNPQYPFDLEQAKAELAKSKYPDGFTTSAQYSNSNPEIGLALQVLAQDLKKIGVTLKLQELSDAEVQAQFQTPNFSFLVNIGGADWPSPISALQQGLCSCAAPPNGGFIAGYDNPQLNRMIEAVAVDPDTASRADKVFQVLQVGAEDIPAPTLWWSNSVAAVNKKLVLTHYGTWSLLQTPWLNNIYGAAGQ